MNVLVVGFDDLIISVMILSVFVTICVWLRFELGRLANVRSDVRLYSNFEIVWLMRPVLVFLTIRVLSLTMSYELISIE